MVFPFFRTLLDPLVESLQPVHALRVQQEEVVLLCGPVARVRAQEVLGSLQEVDRQGDVQLLKLQQELSGRLKTNCENLYYVGEKNTRECTWFNVRLCCRMFQLLAAPLRLSRRRTRLVNLSR